MKNLATCTPTEFLKQSNKIRKSVEQWLTVTDVMNIRTKHPTFTDDMSDEDKRKAVNEQVKENLSEMLDEILEKHPEETVELLALLCFVEPEDADNHKMVEYLAAFYEMLSDETVMDFFTLLVQLAQKNTVGDAKVSD